MSQESVGPTSLNLPLGLAAATFQTVGSTLWLVVASTLEIFDVGQCANMLLQRVDDKRFRDEGSLGK